MLYISSFIHLLITARILQIILTPLLLKAREGGREELLTRLRKQFVFLDLGKESFHEGRVDVCIVGCFVFDCGFLGIGY